MIPVIGNKYKCIQKIGQGAFGSIYEGENIRTGEKVAIKIEPIKQQTKLLKNETKIYQYLGSVKHGVPIVKWFGVDDENNYLVMNLLGESLQRQREKTGPFSLCNTLNIGIQLLQRVKYVHENGLIHRDIKPDNFLFGLEKEETKVYLIDFGFSKQHQCSEKKEKKERTTIIGTPNFISIRVHNYCEPNKKDDLESVMYILLYLYMDKLPWVLNSSEPSQESDPTQESDPSQPSEPKQENEQIKERKMAFLSESNHSKNFISVLAQMIRFIQEEDEQEEDHNFYIDQFIFILKKLK